MFALENRCLRNLRGLNVSNCKGFDDKALLNLAGLEALETLTLHPMAQQILGLEQ
jgi:hypothetical protein